MGFRKAFRAGTADRNFLSYSTGVVSSGWQQLKVGAGGFLTSGDIAPDGTMVCRTDTMGAYRWNASTSKWVQLLTTTSMPSQDAYGTGEGVIEIRIAPSNSSIFYMIYNGYVFKTTDQGANWTQTAFTAFSDVSPLANTVPYKWYNPKMAIDPNDPNHVIVGTPANGVYRTTDGGDNWSSVSGISAATSNAGHQVIFIDSSNILVSRWGGQTYKSTNGGSSFSAAGGPAGIVNWALFGSDVWACAAAADNNIWKYSGGSWTQITIDATAGNEPQAVVVDPNNSSNIIAFGPGAHAQYSTNGGATWGSMDFTDPVRVSPLIGWQATGKTDEDYLTVGNIILNPVDHKIYLFNGINVWSASVPASGSGAITWTVVGVGIENMVANWSLSPFVASSPLVLGFWDRPTFFISDFTTYPSDHGPDYTQAIASSWAGDYASSDPSFICSIIDGKSGYTTDYGTTWHVFSTWPDQLAAPYYKRGGCIAASTPNNIVWIPSNQANPYYTLDGGANWVKISIGGSIPDGDAGGTPTGWGGAYYVNRQIVAADRVTANKFYMMNGITNLCYISTDSGQNWSAGGSVGGGTDSGWAKLRAVPGTAGLLLFTRGQYAGDGTFSSTAMRKSTNSATSWADVPNVTEVYDIGFGKAGSGGGDYSGCTVFIIGKVSGVFGVYYSTDINQSTPTWTSISTGAPMGNFDYPTTISGDFNTFAACYVGFIGSSFLMYRA